MGGAMYGTWRRLPFSNSRASVNILDLPARLLPKGRSVSAVRGARMHTAVVHAPAMPSTFTRWIVGVLVVGHLFAIFIAVTSDSSPNFPAPQLAVRASSSLQPYLQ